jgi:hypothetical protein
MRPIALFAALAMLACAPSSADPGPGLQPIIVQAAAVPLDSENPTRDRVGRLRYLGGVELKSGDPRFGGLSGLRVWSPGVLVAVTDGGHWASLTLREEGDRLVGVVGAAMGLIRGPSREPLRGKAHADAEAVELGQGWLSVAFEREHRVWHYRDPSSPARPETFPDTRWLASLPGNAGIEAMARFDDGWLYMTEASSPDGANEGILSVTGGLTRTYGRVRLALPPGFRVTDAQALGPDRLLVLGRRYAPLSGMSATVAVVPVDVRGLKLGKPEVIATLEPPFNVDNMEGIAVHHSGGRTFVYLVSDDNFSPLQRTLLLKFELL